MNNIYTILLVTQTTIKRKVKCRYNLKHVNCTENVIVIMGTNTRIYIFQTFTKILYISYRVIYFMIKSDHRKIIINNFFDFKLNVLRLYSVYV